MASKIDGIKRDVKEANGVRYYQDWERSEGAIYIVEPKTVDRYYELKEKQSKTEHEDVFFAFNKRQFEEGKQALISKGYIKDESELRSAGNQLFGTKEAILNFFKALGKLDKIIAKECNPQEVYFREWNEHECMITMDDDEAMKIVIGVFGKEVAHTIERVYPGTPINILAPLTERDEHLQQFDSTLSMLSYYKFDMVGFFSKNDCRYHRSGDLREKCVKQEIEEMRKLYNKLPDDIKDASPMSKETIDKYAKMLEEWANEEFSKPEYDSVSRTPLSECPEEIVLETPLFYEDDNGEWKTPSHVWFSCDHRRWHQDERMHHGRAMTSYLGKYGTTLAQVFTYNGRLERVPYVNKDLCDVSCRYERKNELGGSLYKFYYE